jgi:hypothetical protein
MQGHENTPTCVFIKKKKKKKKKNRPEKIAFVSYNYQAYMSWNILSSFSISYADLLVLIGMDRKLV